MKTQVQSPDLGDKARHSGKYLHSQLWGDGNKRIPGPYRSASLIGEILAKERAGQKYIILINLKNKTKVVGS